MQALPDISVVIPTRDRWPMLRRTLDALAAQDLQGVRAEVVVVDNGSSDGSWERLREADGIVALREDAPGAGAARNAGLLAATAPLVLFLGDDCLPASPDLVAGHVRGHREAGEERVAVLGRIEWDPGVEATPVMRWLEETGKMVDFHGFDRAPPGPEAFYTGNVSIPREAALEVGGFDRRFRGYGWEDVDLALRMSDHGMRVRYHPELLVHHAHRYELHDSLARMEAMGRSARLLERLHAHRDPPPGPRKRRLRLAAGRALAPLAMRVPVPASPRLYQAAHLAAFARGYGRDPLADDPALRGWAGERRPGRPAVSVVVPFLGDRDDAERLRSALAALELRDGDEVIVVDNSPEPVVPGAVPAPLERSSYYARNVGAERASGDWLLFVDSDCRPRPTLLDDCFREPLPGRCGAVAGAVLADPRQRSLIARYARSRTHLSQAAHFRDAHKPYGITANLLVRREAWADVGGFYEGLRSGGDADICWRLQDAGWTLAYREHAAVEHRHRERLVPLLRQAARYSAAIAWMDRHHPGSAARPRLTRRFARSALGVAAWTLTGRFERALFKAIDGVVVAADVGGYVFGNRATGKSVEPATRSIAVLADGFPELSETFVAGEAHALERLGHRVRIESPTRARRPDRLAARGLDVFYGEDDGIARKALDLAALCARHPLRSAADLAARRRWSREETVRPLRALATPAARIRRGRDLHLHAHFAAGAALDAMRLARLLGLPYSVTAHAYDIYLAPANLREKLERGAFATSGCDYTVHDLRAAAPSARVEKVVMGVDGERFQRTRPYPGGRTVVAVGRLVEKKGITHLIEAAALLADRAPLDRVVIVGDGPLRGELERLAAERGVAVELVGPRDPDDVRSLLEEADLLAMPCVIAADGDRDSMPVVVKEALAMEVPVVASDEVGLPELVNEEWGRLVPPGDPEALAAAIEEILALPADERIRMGRAGRDWVLSACSLDRETSRLATLIAGDPDPPPPAPRADETRVHFTHL